MPELWTLGHFTLMQPIPRNIKVPVVISVWIITLLVAGYSYTTITGFQDFYDAYQAPKTSGLWVAGYHLSLPVLTTIFYDCWPVAGLISLVVVIYGIAILGRAEQSFTHLIWYATVSFSLNAVWLIWTLFVERSLYVGLFPV